MRLPNHLVLIVMLIITHPPIHSTITVSPLKITLSLCASIPTFMTKHLTRKLILAYSAGIRNPAIRTQLRAYRPPLRGPQTSLELKLGPTGPTTTFDLAGGDITINQNLASGAAVTFDSVTAASGSALTLNAGDNTHAVIIGTTANAVNFGTGTSVTTVTIGGNATTGTTAVDGITTNLGNTVATTINMGAGAATNINIGRTSGGSTTTSLLNGGQFNFYDTASHEIGIKAGSMSGSLTTLVLPIADATASQLLQNDGSGNLSWVSTPTPAGAWLTAGNTLATASYLGGLTTAQPLNFIMGGTGNIIMNISTAGVVNVATGRIDAGGGLYIHKSGSTTNFFAGVTAGNTGVAGINITAVGSGSLAADTTGADNTALGSYALANEQFGNQSVAVGSYALNAQATSEGMAETGNTAVGASAGTLVSSGAGNTLIGTHAGSILTTGNHNVYIGDYAGINGSGASDTCIYIGNSGANENNTIRIGDGQSACYIAGISGATSSSGAAVYVNASGQLGTTTSSIRYKKNVVAISSQDRFMQLRPVTFNYKQDAEKNLQYGLIAEEVDTIYPELVIRNNDGQIETVKYHLLDAIFIREIQENRARIAALQHANTTYQEQLAALNAQVKILPVLQDIIATLQARIASLETKN